MSPAASSANMAFFTQTPIGGSHSPSTLSCDWTSQCSSSSHWTPCKNLNPNEQRTRETELFEKVQFSFVCYLANIDWRRIGRYAAVIRTTLAVDKLWLADGWLHHRGRWTGLSDASQFRRSRAMALFARRFGIHQTFADFHSHIAKLARSLGRCIDDVCRAHRIKLVQLEIF